VRQELEVVRLKCDVAGVCAETIGTILVSSPEVPDRYLIEVVGADIAELSIIDVHEHDLESVLAKEEI
jgi:hypothetical protein